MIPRMIFIIISTLTNKNSETERQRGRGGGESERENEVKKWMWRTLNRFSIDIRGVPNGTMPPNNVQRKHIIILILLFFFFFIFIFIHLSILAGMFIWSDRSVAWTSANYDTAFFQRVPKWGNGQKRGREKRKSFIFEKKTKTADKKQTTVTFHVRRKKTRAETKRKKHIEKFNKRLTQNVNGPQKWKTVIILNIFFSLSLSRALFPSAIHNMPCMYNEIKREVPSRGKWRWITIAKAGSQFQ